jgi:uncharacterized protein (TIGR02145 family)
MNKAKLLITIVIAIMANYSLSAQVAVTTDGRSADASAVLDVESSDKGMLIPRMTQAQIKAIDEPANGLMVYNTTYNRFYFYDNNANKWRDIDNETITPDKVMDYDGNVYNTVQIDAQLWMAEDLRVTHYPNGDAIPHITNDDTWLNLENNNTDDAYCFYNNDNTTDYGALYSYAAAIGDNWARDNCSINGDGGQGICPNGWHIPTDAEWTTLINYLGGVNVAGGKMKEVGTAHWESPNAAADNSSGLTLLPGGNRRYDFGGFVELMEYGDWWSATPDNNSKAYKRGADTYGPEAYRNSIYMSYGISVRCIKD